MCQKSVRKMASTTIYLLQINNIARTNDCLEIKGDAILRLQVELDHLTKRNITSPTTNTLPPNIKSRDITVTGLVFS